MRSYREHDHDAVHTTVAKLVVENCLYVQFECNSRKNGDSRIITGDLRMTKRGQSRTIRETRLGFGETGTRAPGGGSSSHSWGVGRRLPGPAWMPGRRSGRARFAPPMSPPQSLVPAASRCGASAGGLKPRGVKLPRLPRVRRVLRRRFDLRPTGRLVQTAVATPKWGAPR